VFPNDAGLAYLRPSAQTAATSSANVALGSVLSSKAAEQAPLYRQEDRPRIEQPHQSRAAPQRAETLKVWRREASEDRFRAHCKAFRAGDRDANASRACTNTVLQTAAATAAGTAAGPVASAVQRARRRVRSWAADCAQNTELEGAAKTQSELFQRRDERIQRFLNRKESETKPTATAPRAASLDGRLARDEAASCKDKSRDGHSASAFEEVAGNCCEESVDLSFLEAEAEALRMCTEIRDGGGRGSFTSRVLEDARPSPLPSPMPEPQP